MKRVISFFLVIIVVTCLISCEESKESSYTEEKPSKQVSQYLKETKEIVEISQELKQILPACSSLNDFLVWDGNVQSSNVSWEKELKTLDQAEKLSQKGLEKSRDIEAGKVCSGLKQRYVEFFKEVLSYCQESREIIYSLKKLQKSVLCYTQIKEDINQANPASLSEAHRILRSCQQRLASMGSNLNGSDNSLICECYRGKLAQKEEELYNRAGNIAGLIQNHEILNPKLAVASFKKSLDQADADLSLANVEFDSKALELEAKLNNLADEVNNEIYRLDREYPSKDSEDWGEFFWTNPYRE